MNQENKPNWDFYSSEYKQAVKNTISQSSACGRSFTESLKIAGVHDFSLMDTDTQRELIQAWLYPPEINSEKEPTPRVQRKYFNFENQKTIDLLPFNQDTLEKIRLERECMEKDVEGSVMNRSQIWHYLSEGFTITTYQADYVLEGSDFAYDE